MIDCVLKGEGEMSVPQLLLSVEHDRRVLAKVPGVVTLDGARYGLPCFELVDDLRTEAQKQRDLKNLLCALCHASTGNNFIR